MANYLVTGGAGFIGASVSKQLLADGHHVVILDNLSTGYKENIPEGAEFIEGDCQDESIYLSNICETKFDAIYHIAGQSSGEISFSDPVYDLQTNTQSTLLLLNFARINGCNRLLYASSMSVYGDKLDRAVNESDQCIPLSFYGVGKLASEHYLRLYQQYGIQSTALRLFNVYGPGQNMDNLRQGMVSIYLAMALKDKNITVKGASDRFRDFVYINDVVNAFLACENELKSFGKIYNIATGRKVTVENLLEKITSRLPFKTIINFTDGTPGDQIGVYGETKSIEEEVGWSPKFTLDDGLDNMIEWALKERS